MHKHFVFILIMVVAGFSCSKTYAGIDTSDVKSKFESSYIKDFADLLSFRMYGISKHNNFNVYSDKSKETVIYNPNTNLNLGIGFNYKWFGLGVAFNIPFINNDDDKYGKTQQMDLQTNMYGTKFVFDGVFQFYKGFYIKNPDNYINNWNNNNPYPQRFDITSVALGGNFYYIFNNKKYSYKASFVQNALQKKSAGSFISGVYFSVYGINADYSVIPFEIKSKFGNDTNLTSASSVNLGIAAGYSYTFIIKKQFFITLSVVPGLSLNSNTRTENNVQIYDGAKLAVRTQTRFAMGYNNKKYYAGMSAVSDNFSFNNPDNAVVNYNYGNIKIFAGKRFNIKHKHKK